MASVWSKDNNKSPIAHYGGFVDKYLNPLSWIFGDKYNNLVNDKIPELTNSGLSTVMSPFENVDETINPVRRWVPGVDEAGDWISEKPGDTIAAAAGAFYGGGALAGSFGGQGASSAPTSAPTSAAPSGQPDWLSQVQEYSRYQNMLQGGEQGDQERPQEMVRHAQMLINRAPQRSQPPRRVLTRVI